MPCRSDYMEQTNSEYRFQQTAKLLLWFYEKIGLVPLKTYSQQAHNYYATNVGQVEELCRVIRTYKNYFERVMQDNLRTSYEARELANWWEEHQEEDRKREAAEEQEASDRARFNELVANLDANDRRILKERLR